MEDTIHVVCTISLNSWRNFLTVSVLDTLLKYTWKSHHFKILELENNIMYDGS